MTKESVLFLKNAITFLLQHFLRQQTAELGLLLVYKNQRCKSAGLGSNPRVYARGLGVDSELEPEPSPWSSHEGKTQTKPGDNHSHYLGFLLFGSSQIKRRAPCVRTGHVHFWSCTFTTCGSMFHSRIIHENVVIDQYTYFQLTSHRVHIKKTKRQHWRLLTLPEQMKLNK